MTPQERKKFEQKIFSVAETKLIEISKWIESEKVGRDLSGNEFVTEWIKEHAEDVRNAWEHSRCKTCLHNCRYNLKETCDQYCPMIF